MALLLNPRLWIIGLGTVIVPLDSSVNVAFPFITEHFGLPLPAARLLVVTFILTTVSLMLIAGRLGDLWGYRRVFRAGLVLSAIALALDAAAPSYALLLAARVAQGVGAALALSCAPALAIGLFAERQRGPAIGAYAMILAGATALGPMLGGWLIEVWDWRAVFWFRIPLVLAALLASMFLASRRPDEGGRRFDITGALLLGATLATAFVALNLVAATPLGAAAVGVLAAGAAWAFIRQQRGNPSPIIDLAHFRSLGFFGLTIANLLINLAGFSVMLVVPFYLPRFAGADAASAGLVLAAYGGGLAVNAWAAGQILGRVRDGRAGASALMRVGALAVGIGLWLVASWGEAEALWTVAWTIALIGAGLGLFQASFLYVVTGTLPPADRGVAGSLSEVTRSMGNVTAATLLFELFRLREAAGGFLAGFADTYTAAAGIAFSVLAVMLARSLFVRRRTVS